ncbi:MAG: DNA translocase FtsK, partial [Firmicutes bacterium]|nr:DNA translocase FtsK [Bacillota bacterium]
TEKVSVGKKAASIVGISVASILIIIVFCGRFINPDGALGFLRFANFFLGAFGMSFYGIMAAVIVTCSFVLTGKNIRIPVKYVIHFILMFVAIVLFVHILTTTYLPDNFATHMNLVYHYYDDQMGIPTFGGVVFGIVAYGLVRGLTVYGASIVVVALLAWTVYVVADFFYKYYTGKLTLTSKSVNADIKPTETTSDVSEAPADSEAAARRRAYEFLFTQQETTINPEEVTRRTVSEHYDVAQQSTINNDKNSTYSKDQAKDLLFGNGEKTSRKSNADSFFGRENDANDEYLVRGYFPGNAPKDENKQDGAEPRDDWKVSYVKDEPCIETPKTEPVSEVAPSYTYDNIEDAADTVDVSDIVIDDDFDAPIIDERVTNDEPDVPFVERQPVFETEPETVEETVRPAETPFSVPVPEPVDARTEQTAAAQPQNDPDEVVAVFREEPVEGGTQLTFDVMTHGDLEDAKKKVHHYMEYNVPPFELLNDVTIVEDHEADDRKRCAQAIVGKLAVFGIKIELSDIIVGPSVTRYMFTVLSQKTRMGDFKQYSDDIKACVEAQDDIRIEAPVHGTNMVGIEVANKVKRPVVLRSLLESSDFQKDKGKLTFAIGQEITGKVVLADLSEMPHLLIAGTTGSGKSVCLNCLIVSLMYKYGPEYVRFVMVDPKFVELSRYNGIPHMLTTETITTMQDALACMDYLISEMEARYQLFRQNGVDKISEYNKRINTKTAQKLPYLVFVVDELADLMATSKKAFEAKLMRLAQKARAAGIHIVLATQRPDTNVITGTIKSNLPCRMALKVASQYDSQTIIGGGGAEKLLGRGDMLFMNSTGSSELTRVQGAYISNDEIRALVDYSKTVNEVFYDTSISDEIFVSRHPKEDEPRDDESKNATSKENHLDPYCKKALRFWLEKQGGRASIASIQRSLAIGFNRAGRIMDSLQKLKYVEELSPSDPSSKPLRVLISLDELDELFPDMPD